MKKTWEESDINTGMWVCCDTWPEDTDDMSGMCTVTYKLGYIGGASQCMCLLSITDGLVMQFKSTADISEKGNAKQLLVDFFNNDSTSYRILTNKQIIRRMKHLYGNKNKKVKKIKKEYRHE